MSSTEPININISDVLIAATVNDDIDMYKRYVILH